VEICTAIGAKPRFVPDEVRLYIPDVLWSIDAGKTTATLLSRAKGLETVLREWRCRSQ
jgi:hypothetical protein